MRGKRLSAFTVNVYFMLTSSRHRLTDLLVCHRHFYFIAKKCLFICLWHIFEDDIQNWFDLRNFSKQEQTEKVIMRYMYLTAWCNKTVFQCTCLLLLVVGNW